MSRAELVRARLRQHRDLVQVVADSMADQVAETAEVLAEALRQGGTLLFCGNGGSAADAQHLAAEYVVRMERERPGLAAIALTTDTSILTAAGNDLGFDEVFARQVEAIGRPGDVLVVHSTSGRSPNLLRAIEAAGAGGLRTVALLARDGGPVAERVDVALVVPTDSTARAQELHLTLGHLLCELVEASLLDGPVRDD